jgi:hypothetical protein
VIPFLRRRSDSTPATGQPHRPRKVVVALVHPTNYDHAKGSLAGSFPQTYRWGVIPSNTLRLLESLTRASLAGPEFAGVEFEVHSFEDAIRGNQRAFRRLLATFPRPDTTLVVGLVAVQSNQFPRARDLMRAARERGAVCVIGGPHVTASINTALYGISTIDPMRKGVPSPHRMPPEIQELIDTPGYVVFHGDADAGAAWARVLGEIVAGRHKSYYEAGLAASLGDPGDVYTASQLEAFVTPVAAVDTERGCPFKCHFCAAIQAHGRVVRCRPPQDTLDWIRRQVESYGREVTVLFASDNLARNPHWRELLAGLRAMREEGLPFTIWAEADVRCNSGPNAGFLEAYAAAGGRGLFLGIESMNPANIAAAGKKQNDVDQLPAFFAECRRHGIAPEGGYIIGFEHDTPESLQRDVEQLVEAGLARAWFFVKTLLPGSQDWVEALHESKPMSHDLNEFDSTVVSSEHERMTREEWTAAYRGAIRTFYSARSMTRILTQYESPAQRWRLIKGFLWARWAYLTEQSHPMIAGLWRTRALAERRPGQAPLPLHRFAASEVARHARYLGLALREFYVFQQVILDTEWQLRFAERFVSPQLPSPRGVIDWVRNTFAAPMNRSWLNRFWVRYGSQKWRLLNPLEGAKWHLRMVPHAAAEVVYTVRFTRMFLRGLLRNC